MGFSQVAIDVAHLAAAVYIALVVMRVVAQILKSRVPAVSHAIEFAIGR